MNNIIIHSCGRKTINNWEYITPPTLKINRFYYVYSGYALFHNTRLEPGTFYLIPDTVPRKQTVLEPFDHFFIDFTISPPLNEDEIISYPSSEHPELIQFVKSINDILSTVMIENRGFYDFSNENSLLISSLTDTLIKVCDKINPIQITPEKRIKQLIESLNESDEIYTVDDLAEKTNLDKYYLIKLFKQEIGVTPHKYMNNLRLERALSMINAGQKAKEVATKCGFASESSFSTAFKKHFNCSPSQIKKLIINK